MSTPTAPEREHSSEVVARARRVKAHSVVRSKGFASSARLALLAAYSITFMWAGYFDWSGPVERALAAAAAVLWIVLAVTYVRDVRRSDDRRRYMARRLTLPLLLIAPVFVFVVWVPLAAFVLVVLAYILELRYHSAGDGFLFSFGLVLFVGVFAGISMVEIENDHPESTLQKPTDAVFWAFASLLKLNYGNQLKPITHDGQVLAAVVGMCAILAASLFTAQVVTWVVGSQKDEEEQEEEERPAPVDPGLAAELAAIRAELAQIREGLHPTGERPATAVDPPVQ